MKKTYQKPVVDVIVVKSPNLMVASSVGFGDVVFSTEGADGRELDFDDDSEVW